MEGIKQLCNIKYIVLVLFFLSFSKEALSQQCEWLSVGGNLTNNEVAQVVAVDGNNDAIVAGTFSDSFSIKSQFVSKSTNSAASVYIAKYNPFGIIKWLKTIQHTHTGVGSSLCSVNSITTDVDNNIYISGTFGGDINLGNSVTLTSGQTRMAYLAKYDSSGTAQWAVKIGSGGQIGGYTTIDGAGNVFFGFFFAITASFSGTTQTISTGSFSPSEFDIGVVKYSSTGNFIKVTKIGSSDREYISGIGIDVDNNIYVSGSSLASFTYGANTLSGGGEIVLKLDTALTPLKGIKNDLKQSPNYSTFGIAVQANGNFAVVNNFTDSVNFGNNVWLKSPWSGNTSHSLGIVYYDSSLTAIWARTNDTFALAKPSISAYGGISIRNDNIYVGGIFFQGSTRLGNSTLNATGGHQKLFITKMDTLGNFLWAFGNEDTSSRSFLWASMPDNIGNVYVTGGYSHKLAIFNKSVPGPNSTFQSDLFVAKISDYAIYRGQVSSGPYCAGDTLKVPYTKQGVYNIGNEFIAQLSDSAGNFDGDERELGRSKTTEDGIINGFLPLFNVATTNKYRIRIISTDPVVQSYYKFDTLRLLIYSKDSANAGPDRYVCKGEPIKLGTTGGSRWNWSPTNYFTNPADSNNRQPEIKLYDSVEFRIIISDSSGCGDVDTDFVKIYVRPYIEAKIQGDSQVCRGFRQHLKAQTTGGDSTQYWYIWKLSALNLTIGNDANLFVRPYNTTDYTLIVGDSCSDKIDTAYFTVKVVTNLKANPSPDTTICKGKSAQLSVIGTGCNPNKYTYEWIEKDNSTILSTNDSLLVSPLTTTQYQIILKDTSTLLIDTATITVTVDSIFNISTIKDSTICLGQTIDLTANVFSCDTSNMIYTWDNGLGTGKTKTISPNTTTTYTIIGENTFNNLKDTAQVTITVRPKLTLTLNADSTICVGEQAELRATATGGRSSTHNILWSEVGSQWTSPNPTVQVSPNPTTTYKAILSDGCTVNNDSATITITVRPKLEITVNPDTTICIGEQAELRATATGGNPNTHQILWTAVGSQWTVNTPITNVSPTTTTTYKAVLSDGCTVNNDSAEITITVRPKLTLTINQDSTICTGEQVELRATTTGGNPNTHQILWTVDGGLWTSNNPITQVTPSATTTYKALLSDGCTDQNDSAEITITVRPPLQLTTTAKDSICSNETLLLTATPSGGYTPNHQILWTVDNGLWTSQQNPATDTPQINTKYIAALSDNCSPTVYDTLQVIVLPIPKADFTATPTFGCPPLKVTLTDNSTDNDSIQNTWTIGLAEYQSTKTQTHEILKQGVYNIKLNVKNQLGCSDEKTETNAITVFAKPKANFIIKPDIKEVEEALQLYNLSQNATQVIWDMGDGNTITPFGGGDTIYIYDENDTGFINAKIIAINSQGCRDTAEKQILLYNKVHCTIPTAFTPNGDGLNNTFKPVCVGAANYTLTIYNRWGQVIYQRENGEWDGNYADNPSPSGVYMYKLQINAQSQKKKLTYGTVQVIR